MIPEIVFKISHFEWRDSTISSQISREKMNIYQLNFSFFHVPGGDSTRNCEISLLKMIYLDNGFQYYFCVHYRVRIFTNLRNFRLVVLFRPVWMCNSTGPHRNEFWKVPKFLRWNLFQGYPVLIGRWHGKLSSGYVSMDYQDIIWNTSDYVCLNQKSFFQWVLNFLWLFSASVHFCQFIIKFFTWSSTIIKTAAVYWCRPVGPPLAVFKSKLVHKMCVVQWLFIEESFSFWNQSRKEADPTWNDSDVIDFESI